METTGNFLTQPNRDFPLDCETLEMLQTNAALSAAVGNMCGDKLILTGCEASGNGKSRAAGLVFVRTRAFPDGEVLRWTGGDTTGGMYLRTEYVPVSVLGVDYPKAYTRRTLEPGVGQENFGWDEFRKPKTASELEKLIAELRERLEIAESGMRPEPLGIVKIWAGVKVPDGYALCDGAALKVAEYGELYAAIGGTFNNSVDYNGSRLTTQDGYFRLPDLRGRFIAGYSEVDNDYKKYGNAGGEKKHTLSSEEMPVHTHTEKLYGKGDGIWKAGGEDSTPNCTTIFKPTDLSQQTETAGGGEAHENRPPYYVLAYIMKVKTELKQQR